MKVVPKCAHWRDQCHHRPLAHHRGFVQAAKRHEQPLSIRGQQRTSRRTGGLLTGPHHSDQEPEARAKAYRPGLDPAWGV